MSCAWEAMRARARGQYAVHRDWYLAYSNARKGSAARRFVNRATSSEISPSLWTIRSDGGLLAATALGAQGFLMRPMMV